MLILPMKFIIKGEIVKYHLNPKGIGSFKVRIKSFSISRMMNLCQMIRLEFEASKLVVLILIYFLFFLLLLFALFFLLIL